MQRSTVGRQHIPPTTWTPWYSYWPDAILLGTVSPVISEGADAIRTYFTALKLKGSGNENVIQDPA